MKWKYVSGLGNKYKIYFDGRVESVEFGKHKKPPQFLRPYITKKGYLRICIGPRNNRKSFCIHRLIGEYFIPNIKRLPEINHKDGNKLNNEISNLEWVTRIENEKHAWRNGLKKPMCGERHSQAKLTWTKVLKIRKLWNSGGYTQARLGKFFGVNDNTIHNVVNYKTWKVK